jgi:hypothetical protein
MHINKFLTLKGGPYRSAETEKINGKHPITTTTTTTTTTLMQGILQFFSIPERNGGARWRSG